MSKEGREKVSLSLKEYFKTHSPHNKGIHNPKYSEPSAKRLRRNPDYYIKELEDNAKRSRERGIDQERIEQIKKSDKERGKRTGAFRKAKRWKESEISYIQENYKNMLIEDMALYLNRSWSSVEHKMSRLKLTRYNKWK